MKNDIPLISRLELLRNKINKKYLKNLHTMTIYIYFYSRVYKNKTYYIYTRRPKFNFIFYYINYIYKSNKKVENYFR